MRRTLLIATGALALALALPGAALAHHHRGHHHSHDLRAHHAKFHVMHFGRASTTPIAPTSSTPATNPSTPTSPATTPTTATPENAGTVKSYEKEVLTITLNDGSTVSGKVTNDTTIQCIASQPTTPTTGQPSGQDADDDSGPGDDQSGDNQQGDEGNWGGDGNWGEQQGEDDSMPDQASTEPPCDSSALTSGANIRYAELRIGPAGNEFESIWIVR